MLGGSEQEADVCRSCRQQPATNKQVLSVSVCIMAAVLMIRIILSAFRPVPFSGVLYCLRYAQICRSTVTTS